MYIIIAILSIYCNEFEKAHKIHCNCAFQCLKCTIYCYRVILIAGALVLMYIKRLQFLFFI